MSAIPSPTGNWTQPVNTTLMRPNLTASWADAGLLIIRLIVGAVFLFHGSQKLFGVYGGPGLAGFAGFLQSMHVPMSMVGAVLAAAAEFIGGLALVSGVAMRILLVPAFINMIVAILLVHRHAFDAQKHGMEYPLTLAAVLLGLILIGPGGWTFTALTHKHST